MMFLKINIISISLLILLSGFISFQILQKVKKIEKTLSQESFKVVQHEFPVPEMYKGASEYHDIITLFSPLKPVKIGEFINYFIQQEYKDYISINNDLDDLKNRIEDAFQNNFRKRFNGDLIIVLHNTFIKDVPVKTFVHRRVLITFSQEEKYYLAFESWKADTENGGSAKCLIKEISIYQSSEIDINKFIADDSLWAYFSK